MDNRSLAWLSIFAAPFFYLLGMFAQPEPLFLALTALACVTGSFVLGIVICRRAAAARDGRSKGLAILGISLNGLYLAMVLVGVFIIVPALRHNAEKLLKETQAKQFQQQAPAQHPLSTP